MNCKICNSQIKDFINVKEMIFGLDGVFAYGKCDNCGCVQIKDIPQNLATYYPNNYYSLKTPATINSHGKLKASLLKKRDLHYFNVHKNLPGLLFNKLKPNQVSAYFLPYQFMYEVLFHSPDNHIHDVGCGTGALLQYFASLGYKNLSGSDPFLEKELNYSGFTVEKTEWAKVDRKFDAIMMNHVLEHTLNPEDFLSTAHKNLNAKGKLLVRIPVADSQGFEEYRENWVGMEAPRHITLFTQKSFFRLAESVGFRVYKIKFDAVGWHYQASEGYKTGILLKDQDHNKMYTKQQLLSFEQKAAEANKNNKGDTCAFYLERK